MSRRYPQEVKDFLREYIPGHTQDEICAEVKRRFDFDLTPAQVHQYKNNNRIKSGTKGGGGKSDKPEEHIRYIEENCKGTGPTEMAERLNREFGASYTARQIKAFYRNHGLNSGLTGRFEKGHVSYNKGKKGLKYPGSEKGWFREGHRPYNKTEIGTVRVKTDGYLWKKVGEGSRDWKQLHRLVWEEHFGEVPEGQRVTFLDGDKRNVSIDNLVLVDDTVNARLTTLKLRSSNPQMTQAAVTMLQITKKIKELEDS